MGSVKVKLNMRGVREVLTDQRVLSDLRRRAEAIADAASANADAAIPNGIDEPAFHVRDITTRRRGLPGFIVGSANVIGDIAQAKDSALTRAIDAGRG